MFLKTLFKRTAVSVAFLIAVAGNTSYMPSKPSVNKVYLVSCINEGVCSTDNKNARLEDKVMLNLVVESVIDGKKIYFSEAKGVTIDGKKVDSKLIKPWAYGDAVITWYKVGAEKSSYNNWEEGRFVMDTPAYKETKIDENGWSLLADAKPTEKLKDLNEGLGTVRYKVEFYYNDKKISTPGKESTNSKGITNDVHRISFRKDDSFTGWLTSSFNIPYIYGNTEYQVENYIGMDCADFVVSGYRRVGHKIPYTNVTGLYKYANVVVKEEDVKITNDNFYHKGKPLFFGMDVGEGDLLVFDDSHVGVLFKDKSDPDGKFKGEADGVLNKHDIMLHVYFDNPKQESLDFCTSFSILRWKK